jgi:hemerythrin superfamily protein
MTMVPGPIPPPTEPLDLVDALTEEHQEMEHLLTELELAGSPLRRQVLVDVLAAELARHRAAEERYLFPAVREHVPDGDRIADRQLAEHAGTAELVAELAKLEATDDAFDRLLGRLISEIRQHVRDEESELFRPLRTACDRSTLQALGAKIHSARQL